MAPAGYNGQQSPPKYRKHRRQEHSQLEMKVPRQGARPHWYFEHSRGFGRHAGIGRFDPAYQCVLHNQLPVNVPFAACKLAWERQANVRLIA
jgi:hypothetical protein